MILAGDIGGTKTVLSLLAVEGSTLRPAREEVFASRDHATFAHFGWIGNEPLTCSSTARSKQTNVGCAL